MQIVVFGLWHLGCVTAGCLAAVGNRVVGLDLDESVVHGLQEGRPPLHEPGLTELIAAESAPGRLTFTSDHEAALRDAEILWVAFDTPVNERDEADVEYVHSRLETIAPSIRRGTLVLISSQVPVGFTRSLARSWRDRGLRYAYSPENLRLGKALDSFRTPERVIVGLTDTADQSMLEHLFTPFCRRIEGMSIESAEMTKHALNAYLATSVTFINELSRLCEVVGADAKEVERGLKSEGRIGPRAYLAPGAAFAGGTLARDLRFLAQFGQQYQVPTPLFDGVLASNDVQKSWMQEQVQRSIQSIIRPVVAVLGLTYKPGTDTLRRSAAVELCQSLHRQGVRVQAHDPAIQALPEELRPVIRLCRSAAEVLAEADLAIVATEWPDYRTLQPQSFLGAMRTPRVIDQNHFLATTLAGDSRIVYIATGKAGCQPAGDLRQAGSLPHEPTGRAA